MRTAWILLTTALVAGVPAAAQDEPSKADQQLIDRADKAIDQGRYLEPDLLLRQVAFGPDGSKRSDYARQMWEQTHAAVSDWDPAGQDPGHGLEARNFATLKGATLADAMEEIVKRARETRVVILNENHSDSRGRAFGLEVARALRPLGYATLAIETLANDAREASAANKMERITERGALLQGEGYYTRDPVFADFLRQALALGYRPMAYEETQHDTKQTPDEQVASREREQADNLYRHVLRDRPDAKLFIYVGFSHVAEHPIQSSAGAKQRWMAARLKALSGIDPLTIDQTTIRIPDPPSRKANDPLMLALGQRIDRRTVVAMRDGRPIVVGPYQDRVDLQVIHPPARMVEGRPDWLFAMGGERLAIPAPLLPASGIRLVQAFAAVDDPKQAIPLDQVVVTAGMHAPPLVVPPGIKVRLAFEDPPASPTAASRH